MCEYYMRELDSINTSKGMFLFSSHFGKFWKTPDKIYHISEGIVGSHVVTALEVQYRWCPIRDMVIRNFDTFMQV